MKLTLQKRLAARILGIGESRVWINPEEYERVEEAITADDVRRLIKDGIIRKIPEQAPSRARWKIRHEQRKKGRRRGPGKRKGCKTARMPRKRQWIMRIRALRKFLKYLRDKGYITRRDYRRLYRLAKGGMFKSVAQLKMHIESEGILKR